MEDEKGEGQFFASDPRVQRSSARSHRVVRIGRASPRLKWVFTAPSVDMKQPLGLSVIGFEHVISKGPGRRNAAGMHHLTEVALTQPEQGCAIDFRIPADVVVKGRAEPFPFGIRPGFVGLIHAVDKDGLRTPILLASRQIVAPLQDQNPLSGGRQTTGKRGAARPTANYNEIIMIVRQFARSHALQSNAR